MLSSLWLYPCHFAPWVLQDMTIGRKNHEKTRASDAQHFCTTCSSECTASNCPSVDPCGGAAEFRSPQQQRHSLNPQYPKPVLQPHLRRKHIPCPGKPLTGWPTTAEGQRQPPCLRNPWTLCPNVGRTGHPLEVPLPAQTHRHMMETRPKDDYTLVTSIAPGQSRSPGLVVNKANPERRKKLTIQQQTHSQPRKEKETDDSTANPRPALKSPEYKRKLYGDSKLAARSSGLQNEQL